jgi:predicted nucleic acid-binding protein
VSFFVDANIFLRYLAGDDPTKAERCLALFRSAEQGDVNLFTNAVIVAEVIYVFSSRSVYQRSGAEVADGLRPLLEIPGLRIDHKQSVLHALDRYATSNLDFEDCLAVEYSIREGLEGIYSYDRKLGRASQIPRIEP